MSGVSGQQLADALLRPRVVALVGVSDDITKTAARPLHYLKTYDYRQTVYVVNPHRPVVQGEKTYASVSELPEVPDHVFILTNTERAIEALADAGKCGVKVATILAGGFSESGEEGAARENRLKAIARDYGIRVLGPSSIGLVNLHENLFLTANAAFLDHTLVRGGVFCASHSGSMIGALTSRGAAKNVHFGTLVSVGSESDLSLGEICEAALEDPENTGFMLFLESIHHAEKIRSFALAAAKLNKPVVVYKLGRSEAAAELAVSHTGALAGEDDVADALLADCGVARVETIDGFLEALPLMHRLPIKTRGNHRVCVVTTTGGGAAMAVDQLGIRGVDVAPPSEHTRQKLLDAGVQHTGGRIVDLTLAGTKYEVMKAALDIVLASNEFDLVLAVAGSSARHQPELAVKPVIDSAGDNKPLACFVVPEAPDALKLLADAGVPVFRNPESCADVIVAALNRRVPNIEQLPVPPKLAPAVTLNEAEAYELFERVGVRVAPFELVSCDADSGLELSIDYPLVAKVLHRDIAHKTDVGGVVLPIHDAEQLKSAIQSIRSNVEANLPGLHVDQILLQSLSKSSGEVLVGFRRDTEAGPLVMLAAGGVTTEIYRDRSLRLAPIDKKVALEMIQEVKAMRVLSGFRGQERADLDALAEAIVAVSKLALLEDVTVLEAEINPLMVLPEGQGVVAVDALISKVESEDR